MARATISALPGTRAASAPASLARRLAWFVALWLLGVAAVGAVGLVLRAVLPRG